MIAKKPEIDANQRDIGGSQNQWRGEGLIVTRPVTSNSHRVGRTPHIICRTSTPAARGHSLHQHHLEYSDCSLASESAKKEISSHPITDHAFMLFLDQKGRIWPLYLPSGNMGPISTYKWGIFQNRKCLDVGYPPQKAKQTNKQNPETDICYSF